MTSASNVRQRFPLELQMKINLSILSLLHMSTYLIQDIRPTKKVVPKQTAKPHQIGEQLVKHAIISLTLIQNQQQEWLVQQLVNELSYYQNTSKNLTMELQMFKADFTIRSMFSGMNTLRNVCLTVLLMELIISILRLTTPQTCLSGLRNTQELFDMHLLLEDK